MGMRCVCRTGEPHRQRTRIEVTVVSDLHLPGLGETTTKRPTSEICFAGGSPSTRLRMTAATTQSSVIVCNLQITLEFPDLESAPPAQSWPLGMVNAVASADGCPERIVGHSEMVGSAIGERWQRGAIADNIGRLVMPLGPRRQPYVHPASAGSQPNSVVCRLRREPNGTSTSDQITVRSVYWAFPELGSKPAGCRILLLAGSSVAADNGEAPPKLLT
jgi:hypothetical protein